MHASIGMPKGYVFGCRRCGHRFSPRRFAAMSGACNPNLNSLPSSTTFARHIEAQVKGWVYICSF